ncbi:hypothetical protein QD336_17425 [Rhizobium sp. BR 250]
MAWIKRKDGYWSGWKAYRYGQSTNKVTLPQVFKGEARKGVVSGLMDELQDWRDSPFEREGALRAGIRSEICLEGYSWAAADNEAANLIAEAIKRHGFARPSWLEGQPHYSASFDRCNWCGGDLAGDMSRVGLRFCSAGCARKMLDNRYLCNGAERDAVWRSAYRVIQRELLPPKPCGFCGQPFQNEDRNARYCSLKCGLKGAVHKKRRPAKTYDQKCHHCGEGFQSSSPISKFCCTAHRSAFFRRPEDLKAVSVLAEKRCLCCNDTFKPARLGTKYCSARCSSVMGKRAAYARKRSGQKQPSNVIYLTVEIFDSWFKRAA